VLCAFWLPPLPNEPCTPSQGEKDRYKQTFFVRHFHNYQGNKPTKHTLTGACERKLDNRVEPGSTNQGSTRFWCACERGKSEKQPPWDQFLKINTHNYKWIVMCVGMSACKCLFGQADSITVLSWLVCVPCVSPDTLSLNWVVLIAYDCYLPLCFCRSLKRKKDSFASIWWENASTLLHDQSSLPMSTSIWTKLVCHWCLPPS